MDKNKKKVINAWAMYDWANSVYSLVITSAIFPVYYHNVALSASGSEIVNFFGLEIINSVLYSYALSFSFLMVAVMLPLLSGMADYAGKKKFFMKVFVYLGAFSCIGLFFFTGDNIEWGIICCILASVGYSGSLVFYDAFLVEIVTEDKLDMVSARGYALGYIGSVILLIVNLAVIQMPDLFFPVESKMQDLLVENPGWPQPRALEEAQGYYVLFATKLSFFLVGIWWIGFSQIPFRHLPDNVYNRKVKGDILTQGYYEILKVWKSLKTLKVTKTFLLAFFFYNMGVQTIMYLAATFGKEVLALEDGKLIMTILVIQLVAVIGAYTFAWLSKIKGNRFSLVSMVFIWVFICVFAFFITNEIQFFALAFIVGLVMGGIQSLSRSTYSKLIPENTIDHASYFSFYDVLFNLSIVFGTFSYGLVTQLTEMRNTPLVLAGFFVLGLLFLSQVKLPESEAKRI